MRPRLLLALAALVAVAFAACGEDEEKTDTTPATGTGTGTGTVAQTAAPQPTAAPAPTTTAKPQKKKPAPVPQGTAACSVPDRVTKFSPQGVGCPPADAAATEWDRRIDDCNTIDDPSSPEGFRRTCQVQGYTCTAKRDVKSDARFVTCTGAGTIRFTWIPG
jgi:hypothetical protein